MKGLLYGDPAQLIAQLIGIGVNLVWVGTTATLLFTWIDRWLGQRSRREDELRGLDLSEMGIEGYYAESPARSRVSRPSGVHAMADRSEARRVAHLPRR